ncbi:MAG: Sec-independent protein translocase subunit TatB [Burkholderiales bacterium]|nr:Sec-independent protein translocase subunit TatB [Burkholderiales bacterium]
MFDIGFSEFLVIGMVALVVIGPERLPKVARTAGLLFGRMQRYVAGVKADISREMDLDELRKFRSDIEDTARSVESSVRQEVSLAEQEVNALEREAQQTAQALTHTATDKPAAPASRPLSEPPPEAVMESTPSRQLDLGLSADPAKQPDR